MSYKGVAHVIIHFMKLVIQIPCYNEEFALPVTLNALPKSIDGVDEVIIVIINDGSADKTVEVAKACGVVHFVNFSKNRGLASAFKAGLNKALELQADIIVNLDADNQYCSDDIKELIKPILEQKADIAIGTRPIESIKHFSLSKKILQKIGSYVMRVVSGSDVQDAPSGFRAFSRSAALRLNIFDNYTYTLETIIQAKAKGLHIKCVPIRVNPDLRPSKLVKNNFDYILRSVFTMLRIFIVYRPFRFFAGIGAFLFIPGVLLGLRFLYYYFQGSGSGHIQSLILCSLLILLGFLSGLLGVLADLLAINRKLIEDVQVRLKERN